MPENKKNNLFVDQLLNGLFTPPPSVKKDSLRELFTRRLEELKLAPRAVLDILQIEYRTLNGILDGSQKRIDYMNLLKIAEFLRIPKDKAIQLYIEALEKNFASESTISPDIIEFIQNNFDLAVLKKAGFINSINEFDVIEKKIKHLFGLKNIQDYQRPPVDVAFSAGLVKPKNEITRTTWICAAREAFIVINNPNEYSREELIRYFPQIRWHSINVELGLLNIIKDLFKMGVTIYFQPSLPTLHLRGATFMVNDKPCIVLTDYVGFYPTLWFALVHELFHVLFDWDEISKNEFHYHLSDDNTDRLTVLEKEKEADNFAREYLFSKEKTDTIRPFINDKKHVREFALTNHVHPSFVYLFNAYDKKNDRSAWSIAKKENPDIDTLIGPFSNHWSDPMPIVDFVKSIEYKLYK